MSSTDVLKTIKDKEIEYVDLRFTDPRGKLQHVTMDAKMVDEDMLKFTSRKSVNLKSTYSISFIFNSFSTSVELIYNLRNSMGCDTK